MDIGEPQRPCGLAALPTCQLGTCFEPSLTSVNALASSFVPSDSCRILERCEDARQALRLLTLRLGLGAGATYYATEVAVGQGLSRSRRWSSFPSSTVPPTICKVMLARTNAQPCLEWRMPPPYLAYSPSGLFSIYLPSHVARCDHCCCPRRRALPHLTQLERLPSLETR